MQKDVSVQQKNFLTTCSSVYWSFRYGNIAQIPISWSEMKKETFILKDIALYFAYFVKYLLKFIESNFSKNDVNFSN